MPLAGLELKLPLDQYSKLWETLDRWLNIAERQGVDDQSVEECSNLLRILFELHHASHIDSLHIPNLPSNATGVAFSPDGLQTVFGTSDNAYLYSITAASNELCRLEYDPGRIISAERTATNAHISLMGGPTISFQPHFPLMVPRLRHVQNPVPFGCGMPLPKTI
jgi:hypothetical protein